jgi:hypothetical protein
MILDDWQGILAHKLYGIRIKPGSPDLHPQSLSHLKITLPRLTHYLPVIFAHVIAIDKQCIAPGFEHLRKQPDPDIGERSQAIPFSSNILKVYL